METNKTNNAINLSKNLKDFEQIYEQAVEAGQLNIALKAKEIILKNFVDKDEKCNIESFFKALLPDDLEKLADIVAAEIDKYVQPSIENGVSCKENSEGDST